MIPTFEERMKDPEVQETALQFRGNSVVGNCYLAAGRHEEAHIRWDRCFELAGNNTDYMLWASMHKALTFNSEQDHQSAIDVVTETFAKIKADTLPPSDLLIMNYFNLGAAYRYQKDFDPAYENYVKCIDLALKVYGPKHERTMQKYERMGDLYQESHRPDTALYYYQKALIAGIPNFDEQDVLLNPELRKNLARFEFAEVFAEKGRSWLDLYQRTLDPAHLEQSSICFSKADTLFTWIREFYQRDDQLTNFKEYRKFYESALENIYTLDSLGRGNVYQGLQYMEQNRSLILRSALKSKDASQSFGLPDSLYLKEAGLIRELEKKSSEYDQALAEGDSANIENTEQALAAITETLGQFKRKLKKEYPTYVQIKYAGSKVNQKKITQYLEEQQIDHFIAYFWGENDLFCWSQSRGEARFNRIPMDSTLTKAIQDFQRAMSTAPEPNAVDIAAEEYVRLANYLSEKLIWPFFPDLNEATPQKILIIPDGPLQNISFEGLFFNRMEGKGGFSMLPYLVKAAEVRYSFSFNALQLQNKAFRKMQTPRVGVFSFSDGNIKQTDLAFASVRAAKEELPGLLNTYTEKQIIDSIFTGNSRSFSGRAANKDNFIRFGREFDIIHLGIHGKADTHDRSNTYLIFQAPTDTSDYGRLYPYELYDLDLQAKLAFLSACETGLGQNFAGEGTMSMGWAFAYAGVPSTVMSLWQITDNVTPDLIESFYQSLQAGETVSGSLRASKLAFLDWAPDDYYSHPAFWAASIPIGASDALIGSDGMPASLKWSLLAMLLFGIAIWGFRKIS